jgi:hypothetical protein
VLRWALSGIARRLFGFFPLLLLFGCSASTADEMTSTIVLGTSRIDVTFEPGTWQLSQPQLLAWVQKAAEAVAAYYGRYPRPHVRLRVFSSSGHGVRGGQTFGGGGGFIRIRVGSETTTDELARDWMMTHEMIHLAFPSMARIQAGQMSAESMWADLVRDMPKGQPEDGDRGLDHTRTWGRTYWGGALFCLVADVEIRKKTGNRKGLQDAMRAILNAGGDITEDWPIEKALKLGDDAVGAAVLLPMYQEWKAKPIAVDLDSLWQQLGVEPDGRAVRLRDKAPLATVRKAITAAQASQASAGVDAHPSLSGAFAGRRVVAR